MQTVYFIVWLLTLTQNSLSLAFKDQPGINGISLQWDTPVHDEIRLQRWEFIKGAVLKVMQTRFCQLKKNNPGYFNYCIVHLVLLNKLWGLITVRFMFSCSPFLAENIFWSHCIKRTHSLHTYWDQENLYISNHRDLQ